MSPHTSHHRAGGESPRERSDQKTLAELIERTRASPETRGPAFDAQDDGVYEVSFFFPGFVRGWPRGTANCHVTFEKKGSSSFTIFRKPIYRNFVIRNFVFKPTLLCKLFFCCTLTN